MKTLFLTLALGTLLFANALALLRARQNRSGTPASTIDLTERELWLEELGEENSARFLQLEWVSARRLGHKYEDGPGWFDAAKLRELGYPIDLDALAEATASRVAALPTMDAFAVLEYGREGGLQGQPAPALHSRLFGVDVGHDPKKLREKYPDADRYVILHCLVLPVVERHFDSSTRILRAGYVRGAIVDLTGSRIYVPPAQGRLLGRLGRKSSREYFSQAAGLPPRFAATIVIGSHFEPWLVSVRLPESK